jgi:hypothetical protein
MIVLAKLQLAIAFRYFCKIGMHPAATHEPGKRESLKKTSPKYKLQPKVRIVNDFSDNNELRLAAVKFIPHSWLWHWGE